MNSRRLMGLTPRPRITKVSIAGVGGGSVARIAIKRSPYDHDNAIGKQVGFRISRRRGRARAEPAGRAWSLGIIVVPAWLPSATAYARMAQSRPGNRRGMGC